jgi:L-ascorbate metabolism protein UlaG (beta-lactamase superfamily)
MTRLLGALLAFSLVVLAAAPGAQQPKGSEKPKGVRITYHGQSFFEVRSSKGTNVVLDPHLIEQYGRPLVPIFADLILMSHPHNDHTQVSAVANGEGPAGGKAKATIIPGWKGQGLRTTWNLVNETVKDVKIRSVGVYHDEVQGLKRGKNTVFILEMDGWKIVHLGDLGHLLTREKIKEIGPMDVLMIPVGGVYTLNGSEAKEVVEQLKPKEYIIPMHYGTPRFDDLLPPTEFLEDQPKARVAIAKDNKFTLNLDPQRPRPLITVLNYWPMTQRERKESK